MTEIEAAFAEYTEKQYRFISIYKNPGDHSCDNLLLITATTHILFPQIVNVQDMHLLALRCEVPGQDGVYVRYPKADPATQMCQHDDLTGIAVGHEIHATEVVLYGETHFWTWGKFPSGWFGRIIDFPATVKYASGRGLNVLDRLLWSLGIAASCLTAYGNTSGKCLAYLKIRALENDYMKNRSYWLTTKVIRFWRKRMTAKYPGGLRELYSVWFQDPNHPLRRFAPEQF